MKKVFTFFTLIASSISLHSQTCFVNTSSSTSYVCQGGGMTITADHGFTFPTNQFFDFNTNQAPPGWGTIGVSNYAANTCGQHPSGTPYYWANTAAGITPTISTASFDVCTGGFIQFDMKYAIQGGPNPCEGPDEIDEGVSLQYSIDGGLTWIDIAYYRPDGVTVPSNIWQGQATASANGNTPFTVWSTFNVPIPPGAVTTNTRFRWIQFQSSGGGFDAWGLDNIGILAGACINTNLVWSNGLTNVDDFTFTPTADTCFTASLYDTNNNFLCSDQICIQVMPTYTSSFNRTICNGETYMWGNNSSALLPYTTSGSYPATFTSVYGCDSTVTLNLTVNPIFNSTINASICNGQQYAFAGNNYTTTGNYPVVFQSVGGCDSTVTLNLTVNPIPVATAVTSVAYCNGAPSAVIQLGGTVPNTTYNWTNDNVNTGFPASGVGDIGSVNVTNTGPNPIVSNFTVTPTANNCVGTPITFTITVNPTPTVAGPIQSQTLCNGVATNAVPFTGAVNGTVFAWTNSNTNIGLATAGNGNIASFSATNNGNAAITGNITVTPSANNCTGTPLSFNITVNPTPTIAAITNQIRCNGVATDDFNFNGPVIGTTFAWTNDNVNTGLAATGNGAVIASFTATNTGNAPITSTITVTPSANNCVGIPISTTLTVNPTPTVAGVTSQTICNGDSSTTVSFIGNVNNTAFDWANSNANIGLGAAGSGAIPSFVGTNNGNVAISGAITVTPSANNCVGTPIMFNVTVNPTPNTAGVANQIRCNGTATDAITFNGTVNLTTFAWTNDNVNTGLAASGNGNILSFTATNTGNTTIASTITVTPSANNCIGVPTTTTLTVHPTPNVYGVTDQIICNGDPSTAITFNGDVNNTAFNWTNDETSTGLAANGLGSNIPSFATVNTGSTPVISTVIVTPSANNCTGLAETFQIIVNPTHVGTPVSTTICDGDTYTFGTGSFTVTGSYPVIFPNVYGCDSTVTLNLLVYPVYSELKDTTFCDGYIYSYGGQTFTAAGSYPVMFQTINGCDSLVTLTITVTPAPIPFAGNDLVLCSNEVGNLGTPPFLPSTIYTWTGGQGLSDYSISNPTVSINSLIPVTNTYVIQSDNQGCMGWDTVQVRIVPYPVLNIPTAAAQCFQGNSFSFTAGTNFNQTDVFAWSFSNANIATSSQVSPTGVRFVAPGTHQVSVVVTNEMCPSYDTTQVVVFAEPIAALTPLPAVGCVPLTVQFQNNSTPSNVTSQWTFGNGQSSTNNAPSNTYTTVGTFNVSLVVTSADGCVDTATYNSLITTYPVPVAGFTAVPQVIYMDDPYVKVNDNSMYAVDWSYTLSSGGQYQTPGFYHQFADTGYHQIIQVVTNEYGCTAQIDQSVYVRPASSIYVPNAFTPNIDDINSTFGAYGNEIHEFHMRIHDRWGVKMFDSRDINHQWDGTVNNKPAKQDVYVYKIDYVDHRGNQQSLLGRVTLIR
jgi:gliding motility-associated-like protein